MPADPRRYRAGDAVEDLCRACKIDRRHTVIVADPSGRPLRVQCDYCGSQHNFRGGPSEAPRTAPAEPVPQRPAAESAPFPLVADRECHWLETPMTDAPIDPPALERLIRRVIREESGLTTAVPAERWRGGSLVLRPGTPGVQEKSWPTETFFHKVVMIRNRLRTLEQQVNASDLPEDAKLKLQSYVTGCYGSLTSFNVLFADEEDQFRGAAAEG